MRKFCVILLSIFSLFSYAFCVPSWVKPGLVVVYSYEGGSATKGFNTPTSAFYGRGYQIFVVHNVKEGKAYGLNITLLGSSSSLTYYTSKLGILDIKTDFGFFVNPGEANAWLKQKPPRGCKVSGVAGRIAMECQRNQEVTRVTITYDTGTGLIKEMLYGVTQYQGGWGSTQAVARFLRMFYIKLPVLGVPPIAASSHIYHLYTASPMGTFPTGRISITFAGRYGSLLRFYIQTPVGTQSAFGDEYAGPFYIHPHLLRREVILNIPAIGYTVEVAGSGPQGRVLVNHIWNQRVILQQKFDPSTGLLLYERQPVSGMGYQILQLIK